MWACVGGSEEEGQGLCYVHIAFQGDLLASEQHSTTKTPQLADIELQRSPEGGGAMGDTRERMIF